MHWPSFDPRAWLKRSLEKPATDSTSTRIEGEATEPVSHASHLALGRRGEALAASHLEQCGYRLVASNFLLPVGRNMRGAILHAEIDIVAYDGPTLCFVEVKTRASDWFAPPEANVDLRKQRQVARAARAYRRLMGLTHAPYRYDVVSVVLPQGEVTEAALPTRLELLRNFWTDDRFRKRRWADAPYDL
ncbi:MAG TPA: YraN family protein [Pyrinomonadaceae bacterium]|jgi:putative endonuclease|nr:YraN family protein [Pyrinomonadaceae bacterium]